MNNNDRRVCKTKTALKKALLKLMEKNEIRNITIKELTDLADIHRATFYKHYQDVYDLYEQLEKSVLAKIDYMIKINPKHTYDTIYLNLVNYVYENNELLKVLLGDHGNKLFEQRFCNLLEKKYLDIWLFEEQINEISEEMRYLTTYHIQGCLSILNLWVKNNLDYPIEKILELIQRIDFQIEQI